MEPVYDINVAYDFMTPGVNKTVIKYEFPKIKTKNKEAKIMPITIDGLKPEYLFLSFDGDTLVVDPMLISPFYFMKQSEIELMVHTNDDKGLIGNYPLKIKIRNLLPPPPEEILKPPPEPVKPPSPPPPPLPVVSRPLVAYLSDFDNLGLFTLMFNQPLVHDSSRRRLQALDPA